MSRYAQNHPEQFEPGGEGFEPLYDERAADEARETAEVESWTGGPNRCAACGEPCRGHWCSESCRRAEDGLSQAEADQIDYERGDDDE